jgi:protein-arginine kinase
MNCPDFFFPNAIKRVHPLLPEKIKSLAALRTFSPTNWKDIRFRIRIARCFRQGFFPRFTRREEEVKKLLFEEGFAKKSGTELSIPLREGTRFYLGEEDHIRFEWILPGASNFPWFKLQEREEVRFLFRPRLWAWKREWGFINSCPTNCGRGDRLSVQMGTSPAVFASLSQVLSPHMGFGIEFSKVADEERAREKENASVLVQISCKNGNPLQKLRFFKILGLLGLG